jgi:S-adenosylmethionine decarboxylase
MTTIAKHILVDFKLDRQDLLTQPHPALEYLREAVVAGGATVLQEHEHQFNPGGYTGFLLLAQSHATIHTWPEDDMLSIDVFACGDIDKGVILRILRERFTPVAERVEFHRRGFPTGPDGS